MLVIIIEQSVDDNPDTQFPSVIDTNKINQVDIKDAIESAIANDRGYAEVTFSRKQWKEWYSFDAEVLTPVTGTIQKIVTIWH